MCGIAGFIGAGDESFVRAAAACLRHRGPDDAGWYFAPGVGLAQTRLSIIDLSPSGHQPMWNAKQTLCVVFNGEIYNFAALREELVKLGFAFKGGSDTEVLLAAYEAYGTEAFQKLEGMFAVAFYDVRDHSLVLVRDRLGKKPLYYAEHAGGLVFGSEPKALLGHPAIDREIDLEALQEYLAFEYVPAPRTLFKGMRKLPPGTFLKVTSEGSTMKRFWNPSLAAIQISEPEAIASLDRILSESVAARMVADVPVGVLLSGGLDSSAVAHYAKRHAKGALHTFSARFSNDPSFDESAYAEAVAKKIGTVHHVFDITEADALAAIDMLPALMDDPFADASIIPTYLLSRLVRQHVTVALGGDGADELFLGYPTFRIDALARVAARLPRPVLRVAKQLSKTVPATGSYFSLSFKIERFLQGAEGDQRYMHQRFLGGFTPERIEALLEPAIFRAVNPYAPIDPILEEAKDAERLTALSYEYVKTYMADMVLAKVDRASMAHGLEVRAPFLDYRIAEWAFSLPANLKLRSGQGKYVLRRLMEGKLPENVVRRPKHGFALPLSNWLRSGLRERLLDTLSAERLNRHGIFNAREVEKLIGEHLERKADRRKELWTLLVFQMWYDTWH